MKYVAMGLEVEAVRYNSDEESWNKLVRMGVSPSQEEKDGKNIKVKGHDGQLKVKPGQWVVRFNDEAIHIFYNLHFISQFSPKKEAV